MCRKRRILGSALILTVVLTSLLAIVGVLFLMITRVDRMATSATSQNRELDLAIDAVVAKISGQLIWDVPGTVIPDSMIFPLGAIFPAGVVLFADGLKRPEYHDYPGPEDTWLAASEPNNVKTWPQISDVTGYLARMGWRTRNVPIAVIPDHSPIVIDPLTGSLADADGDGVADSKWVVLEGVTSSRGEAIYAAVRVTDNAGKINVNTAYRFDPCDSDIADIDGTNLMQINLMALSGRPGDFETLTLAQKEQRQKLLREARAGAPGLDPNRLDLYEANVIWHYDGELALPYTPFDISDELELRNRFLLNQRDTHTRIERFGWARSFCDDGFGGTTLEVPIGSASSGITVGEWFDRAFICDSFPVDRVRLNRYDYRHIATTCSMDRIINPIGPSLGNGRMVNVNTDNLVWFTAAIREGLVDADPNLAAPAAVVYREGLVAQITANLIDYRDADSLVRRVAAGDPNRTIYYGFERPCIYISEVAAAVKSVPPTHTSYAIELHKPYFEDNDPCVDPSVGEWQLKVGTSRVTINWTGIRRFHVVRFQDPNAPLPVNFNDPDEALYAAAVPGYTPVAGIVQDINGVAIGAGTTIYLERSVPGAPGGYITVDSYTIPAASAASGWLTASPAGPALSIQRDISPHKCIRRLWDTAAGADASTLGRFNTYIDSSPLGRIQVQAHPYLDPAVYRYRNTGIGRVADFKNIGEIGMVFAGSGYDVPAGSTDADLRLDFNDVRFARLLNYLTVIDPADNKGRIKGRINVNTAPPFVLEQLPWMAPARVGVGPIVSQAVVAYRDKIAIPGGPDHRARAGGLGFRSIGELKRVPEMGYYGADGLDQWGFPDLTPLKFLAPFPLDGAKDDFEERDLIFHRISNLITVRSDVFTAYILVRIGADGPQRRMIAILDRSEVKPDVAPYYTKGKVKTRALHQVPDPW